MKRFLNILFLFAYRGFPFALLLSCISPIDFRAANKGGQIVITGQISTLDDRNKVQIGRTADGVWPTPISGALVELWDNHGNVKYYIESSEGIYELPGIHGLPGSIYHLRVILPDGEVYESEPEKMPPHASPVQVSHEFVEDIYTNSDGANLSKNFIRTYATTALPIDTHEKYYLTWTVEETFLLSPTDFPDPFGRIPPPCFVRQSADPNRVPLFDGSQVNAIKIDKLLICSRLVDRTFLEKHYFSTYQSFITKEAHEYWRKVNILANQTGSVFDTPPARIIGNMFNVNKKDEPVWGFFQATNETYSRFFLLPTDFPYPVFFPIEDCTYNPNRTEPYTSYCLNCLTYRNSSYRRPDWF